MFSVFHLPGMEVVRNNIESGIDADAYFYSEVSDFHQYEEAVRNRHRVNQIKSEGVSPLD